jgi:hypothetical protein
VEFTTKGVSEVELLIVADVDPLVRVIVIGPGDTYCPEADIS